MQRSDPKMLIFQQGEDFENYLRQFEHLVRTWKWPEQKLSYRLVLLLTGQALEAICQSLRPKNKKEVRSFLGLVGWYRRFVPNFSIATPLTNLLSKSVAKPCPMDRRLQGGTPSSKGDDVLQSGPAKF